MKQTSRKKFGIRAKLLACLVPVVTVAFLGLIAIAYLLSLQSIRGRTEELLHAQGTASANEIEKWQQKTLATLDTAIETMFYLKMTDEEIVSYEEKYLGTYEDFPNGIYMAYENGKVLDATGWEPDIPAKENSWYREGMEHSSFAFGEPYKDMLTNEYVVTASKKFSGLNGRSGVACADVGLNILSKVVSDMKVVGDGDAFIIDAKSGVILAHRDTSLLGLTAAECGDSFYTAVYQDIAAGQLDKVMYSSETGKYMVNIQNIDATSWYLVSRGLTENINSDVEALRKVLTWFGLFIIAVICIIMVILINRITGPIRKMTDTIVAITGGDFTADVEVKGNDEITIMAQNMKEFLSSMRETIGTMKNISDHLDERAKNSAALSGELYASADGQSQAMGQMNTAIDELVRSITVIAENANSLAQTVAQTSDEGTTVLNDIDSTMKATAGGKGSMESVTASMNNVDEGMRKLEESISYVGDAADKINEITSMIHGIAEETNLLSLNASIEAARAGEAGRGFAVVATQIKSLAETSANAADEITDLIRYVTQLIQEAVNRSKESKEQITDSVALVNTASVQFNEIYAHIENMNEIVNAMINEIHRVNDVASNMAAITQEQSASAEEIEATAVNVRELADSVTKGSSDVKADAQNLEDTAKTLKEKISGFTI